MNFETLKLGFKAYLEEISEVSNKTYSVDNSDISIFMYANEFKSYLADELNCDSSIYSKSINEILDMEIINGQLVDAQEQLEAMKEEEAQKTNQQETAETNTDETQTQTETQTENDLPVLTSENTEKSSQQSNTQLEDPNLITNILNDLLQDSTFKEAVDRDQDGKINEQELSDFFDVIKNYDNDAQTISLDDLIAAAQDIQDGVFVYATDEQIAEEIGETPLADAAGLTGASGGSGTSGASGSGGSFSVPSTYNEAQSKLNESQEKTLDNMTEDELNSELKTAQSDLSDKQSTLSAILDGSDPAIAKLQEAVDDAYEIYQEELEKVDEDMAEKVDNLKNDIDAKEKEIDAKEQEISDQECVVSESENAYNNAVDTRENLENILSTLESLDTSDMDSEKSAALSSKISQVKSQIEQAKKAEENAKKAWDDAEEKLKTLQEEKEELQSGEGGLDELNEQMTKLEEEIAKKYPEIKEYMDAYNDAKEDYKTQKEKAISDAKSEVQDAQDYVNEVQTAITNVKNQEDTKEYCMSDDLADEVLEFAYSMRGFSEGQVEAQCGYNLPDGLWCAAFVKYVLTETYGDDLPSWYTNCNYNSCSEVLAAANNNGCAFKDANDAKPGDLIIFNTSRGNARHIGIVVSVENGVITTIEGNTGSKVEERTYEVGSSKVNSFVRVSG